MPVILSGNDVSTFSDGARSTPTAEDQQFPGYQQGIWTPNFICYVGSDIDTTKSGTTSVPAGFTATWCRVGNLVTFGGYIKLDGQGTLVGEVALTGHPYPVDTSYYSGSVSYWSLATAIGNVGITLEDGRNYALFRSLASAAQSMAQPNYGSDFNDGSQIIFTMSYLTTDTTWQPINGATIS